MPEPIPDLIPDVFHPEAEESPATILRTQADLLGAKTNNAVLGEVVAVHARDRGHREFGFDLVVPALEGYRFQAMWVRYPLAGNYPVELASPFLNDGEEVFRADNRGRLLEMLRTLFTSPGFGRTVSSLIREAAAVSAHTT